MGIKGNGPRQPPDGVFPQLGRWVGALLLTIAMGLAVSPAGLAAPPDSDAPPPPTLSPAINSANIPSEKVSQFVTAYLQVVDLIDARSEELERATTEAESLKLQQDIQRAAYDLIEENGLTRQDYWQLLGLANTDAEFRDRILAQLEERDR